MLNLILIIGIIIMLIIIVINFISDYRGDEELFMETYDNGNDNDEYYVGKEATEKDEIKQNDGDRIDD